MSNFNSIQTFPQLLSYIDSNITNDSYLSYLENGKWIHFSSADFVGQVTRISEVFYAQGVRKGSCVGIVSDSSPFWLMIDFALQRIGAISVPIFANIAKENLAYEFEDAGIEYCYIASQEKYDQISDSLASMKVVITHNVRTDASNTIAFEVFQSQKGEAFESSVEADDIATIIYTSGSTGRPKGVELTHGNFISQIQDVSQTIPLTTGKTALSFLPLAHIFERMVMAYYLASGISVYFADDVKNVGNLIKEIRPHYITVVPRLLDKIYTKMHEGAAEKTGIAKIIAGLAFHRADNKSVEFKGLLNPLFHALVYKKLLAALGGNIELMISGGAPLSPQVERFFTNIGVPLYQGYGLSESSPVISANSPTHHRFGSCGLPFPSVEVKLLADGELAVRGPNVMKGYHNQPQKSAETIVDGWLHTGDLAEIDSDGYIYIKSRKKELFKTSTGKYVSAIAIEQKIAHHNKVDYALIVADNRPFVTALIFMDPLQTQGDFSSYVNDPKLQEHMDRYIRRINRKLNKWERIQKFELVDEIPSIDNHILTPSMKVARNFAYEHFSDVIEAMYQN